MNEAVSAVSSCSNDNRLNNTTTTESAISLVSQVELLKTEILHMQHEITQFKEQKRIKEEACVSKWIQDLLFVSSAPLRMSIKESKVPSIPMTSMSSDTQLLKTVDQVAQALVDGRYSADQVNKIFQRLSQHIPKNRVDQSLEQQPLLQLLVEACGKLDCLERHENANKRWNGRVERDLRRKVLALEWGIDLEEDAKED
jgi:hypothetical protein